MSLVTFQEAQHLRFGIDVEGVVKCMGRTQLINLKNGDIAHVSNAQLHDGYGNIIKVSFWDDDIKKVRNNLKIKIINARTKLFNGEIHLYKSKEGVIDVQGFNPNVIFEDIENFFKCYKNIKSIEQYYNYVKNSPLEIYLGTEKSHYLSIIDEFITIECARKKQTKANYAELSALYYLHQVITLSPVRIRQILHLFGIDVSVERILRISLMWDKKRFELEFPKIKHTVRHYVDEKDREETLSLEITTNELPNEITIDDNPEIHDSEKPLCESNLIEFERKYKGYINFYSDPW